MAGLIDGEGNFGASYSVPSRKEPKKHVIRAYFQIGMTDEMAIKTALRILRSHGIVSTDCMTYKRMGASLKWKPIYSIRVCGLESIVKTVELLEDKLVTKRQVAEHLKSFCLKRLERKGKSRNSPYTTEDISLVEKIRAINYRPSKRRRALNDFTPRLPIEGRKIKSELSRE